MPNFIAPPARLRPSLLHSASLTALLVASPARAGGAYKSLTQALASASKASQAAISPAIGITASAHAALGAQNLARATAQFHTLSAALTAAAQAGAGGISPIVVDGYGPGHGLQAAQGAASGNALWQGALTPDDPVNAGGIVSKPSGVSVTVKQTAPVARLSWRTFNVGAHTTLNFDQSAGGTLASSWIAINSVADPSANPAQILGAIHAQGKVYVLDVNGIAFGAGSTVNVGSLIAATAVISTKQFSTDASGQTTFNLYGAQNTSAQNPATGLYTFYNPTFVGGTASPITVDPGASIITAPPTGTNAGGYVMLLGGNVTNAGLIATQQGQTILAAGTSFTLRQGFSGSVTAGNATSTTLGSEVATTNAATGSVFTTGGVANNASGVIVASQGDISLVGHALTQSGVLLSTTTVNTRGTIHFLTPTDGTDPASSITIAPNSVTEIMPEDNGQTELASQRAANIANSATANALRITETNVTASLNLSLNTQNFLPDQLGESRVEISTGGAVAVGAGALVQAQGGQIAVGAGNLLTLASGATLDVSGTTSAVLPAAINSLLVNVQPFQLSESPGNRPGATVVAPVSKPSGAGSSAGIKGANVYIDARTLVEVANGAYAGNIYTRGGLLQVGGFLGQIPHTIGELTAIGGQVTLQAEQRNIVVTNGIAAQVTTPGTIVTKPGSVINLQGGLVNYAAGALPQTYLQTADGLIYDVNTAPANLVYTGVYGGFVVDHARWHVTDTFNNPLITPATSADPAYAVGRDAGTLTLVGGTEQVAGSIYAGVSLGQQQTGPRPAAVADPFQLAQTVVPQAGTLLVGNYLAGMLQVGTQPLPAPVTFAPIAAGAVPVAGSIAVDTNVLNASGLANITLSTGGDITVSAPVSVAVGGTISLTGANLAIDGGLTARSGAITLTDEFSGIGAVGTTTSVALAPGVVLDTRGLYTNVQLSPSQQASLSHAAGGSVSIVTAGGIDLAAGARIDVSSGGGILANGAAQTATGGSVTVEADITTSVGQVPRANPVVLDAAFVGYGSAGGGTLTVTAPDFEIGTTGLNSVAGTAVSLGSAFFNAGFKSYVVDGAQALNVLPGAQVTAAEPIYAPNGLAVVPTGGDPSQAYTVVLPPLYTPTRGSDVLTQRANGASISLLSVTDPTNTSIGAGGTITVGAGAHVTVDPKQSISIAGYDQVSIFGTLTAHAGTIAIGNTRQDSFPSPQSITVPSEFLAGVSDWIGSGSLIDVSGQAVVEQDQAGVRFGFVTSGGTIALGGYNPALPTQSTWAQVILRPGATLDADGAAATVDAVPNLFLAHTILARPRPVTLAGAGGTISARSLSGIALDGSVLAHAGDAQVAGGSLNLTIDPTVLGQFSNVPTYVYQSREVLISNDAVMIQPVVALPGSVPPPASYGLTRISQQQIDTAGLDAVSVNSEGGAVNFEGSVSLHTARSLTFGTGIVGDTAPYATVQIASPHVTFAGYSSFVEGGTAIVPGGNALKPAPAVTASFATLAVSADLLEFGDLVYLGGSSNTAATSVITPFQPGFGPPDHAVLTAGFGFTSAAFTSTGDIRLLGTADTGGIRTGQLTSIGDYTFTAGQIYPTSGRTEVLLAGYNTEPGGQAPLTIGHTITVQGLGGAPPQLPYSVGGTLSLIATTILQGGVLRAPEGMITLSDGSLQDGPVYPSRVLLETGSITSVSLDGQSVPFGGTSDGVSYTAPIATMLLAQPLITVQTQSLIAQNGAAIDLRGGGTLTGAGFVFGRGGTADVLTTPLLDISGGVAVANALAQVTAIQPVRSGDPVYAILPGYQSAFAPPVASGDQAYTPTQPGERITVTAGEVPGLAAGTYTLLPAYYALQQGGYRVELTTGTQPAGTSFTQGNYTAAAPVTVSFADTTISSPTPVTALFTSGINVRQLSQYDEESYSTFAAAQAALLGTPRPFLPQDAKTLELIYPSIAGTETSLSIAPPDLLKTPGVGGYGATLSVDELEVASASGTIVNAALQIAGPGDMMTPGVVTLSSSVLSGLDVPRLVLGGALSAATGDTVSVMASNVRTVTILPNAVLTAGEVLLTATRSGTLTVAPGATISTVDAGPTAFDIASGYYINNSDGSFSVPVLDISAGQIVFLPNITPSQAASVNIGDGSHLLATGSLNIVAPSSTQVGIGAATFGGKYISLGVAAVNIGTQDALNSLTGQLPTGLNLTPMELGSLLNGDPTLGTPPASQFFLTATQEVNLLGSVSLNTGSTDFVLNTPAIYGAPVTLTGATVQADATIATAAFTWNGIAQQVISNTGTYNASIPPGAQIAAGLAGQSGGSLSIQATGAITLGYGPQTQPDSQTQLDRVVAGFAGVNLQSATEITANNKSALAVYQRQPVFGQPGTGGTLSLIAPLVTTDPGAVLSLAAGGAVNLAAPPGVASAATSAVTTLGGEIDVASPAITISTAVALPSGRVSLTAAGDLSLLPGSVVDLSGRTVHLLDQTVYSPGGTLTAESTAGNIAVGGLADVSSPGASGGSLSFSALQGDLTLDGALRGSAIAGQTAGGVTLRAGTLSTTNAAPASAVFGLINASLDAGGIYGTRIFETGLLGNGAATTPDILIGNDAAGAPLLVAHDISVTADRGAIDVTGTVNASGTGPGSIALQAAGNLVLDTANGTPVLDAHATTTAIDSYGAPIDAVNRAHVTLTSTAGSLLLGGGTVDLRYLNASGQAGTPAGVLALNAPRIGAVPRTTGDIAIDVSGPLNVQGAQSIALYGWTAYSATDALGSIAQSPRLDPNATVTLDAINLDNAAFVNAAEANGALAGRLGNLVGYGTSFHLRPGVEIDSSAASGGNLTIVSDLDLGKGRYTDVGYGTAREPGAVVFRAANNLIVNGSVTDGFGAPPDIKIPIPADKGWTFGSPDRSDPFAADVFLPSTIVGKVKGGGTVTMVALDKGTSFDETRSVSLNYPITIKASTLTSGIAIPFGAALAQPITAPAGGFVTTAAIQTPGGPIPAGTLVQAGTTIPAGSIFAAGSFFPTTLTVQVATGTVVPAGTPLSVFHDFFPGRLVLAAATGVLPVDAFIPSNTHPKFLGVEPGGAAVALKNLLLRPDVHGAQGYVYALAPLLPSGSLSWNLDFVAGANMTSADLNAVQSRSALDAQPQTQPVNTAYQGNGNLILDDQHYFNPPGASGPPTPAFSVIRTGTGDLSLVAGGNFDQSSLYGIYTAGTQTLLPGGAAANAPYNLPRAGTKGRDLVGGGSSAPYNQIFIKDYQAYYPNGGGDVLVAAQGSITGDVYAGDSATSGSSVLLSGDLVGNWLWRQGGSTIGVAASWWINFGSLATSGSGTSNLTGPVQLVGFQGVGALGGGNVSVTAGQNAGQTTDRSGSNQVQARSEGLIIAVGSTGRVLPDSSLAITGGGNLSLEVGGTLNPINALEYGLTNPLTSFLDGAVTNIRGNTNITAGAIGRIESSYGLAPASLGPFAPYYATDFALSNGGVEINPGDGTTTVQTNRDLVLDGVGDPGRIVELNSPLIAISQNGIMIPTRDQASFSLWTPSTSIRLFSSGGNVTPTNQPSSAVVYNAAVNVNDAVTDYHFVYPSQLYATAATGDIVYSGPLSLSLATLGISLEVAPSINEQVAFLAGGSIFAGSSPLANIPNSLPGSSLAIDLSGANPVGLSTPANVGFTAIDSSGASVATNSIASGPLSFSLFALEADTPTVGYLSAAAQAMPALFYAATGDLVSVTTGETETFTTVAQQALQQWYLAAKPVRLEAGRDIVGSGTPGGPALGGLQQNQFSLPSIATRTTATAYTVSGNLFLNNNPNSISVVSAGRDITNSYFYVGGPGLLEVDAGRNITATGGLGSFKSLGSLAAGAPISLTGGAGISVLAGLGTGADYSAFADLYLNNANLANPALQITDPANTGKVQETYGAALLTYLQQNYAYTGDQAGALAYFLDAANVPVANQDSFLRTVFFNELLASGQQYNNTASRFFGSYVRGRSAIDTLLPGTAGTRSSNGVPAGYAGAITLTSAQVVGGTLDAGVATEHGGDIQVLDPGGEILLGTNGGVSPGPGTGLITNGSGNIDVFAKDSVLLGKSRIFTNAGGNIQIWSAEADINAGVGARTDVTFTPPVLNYDNTGGIVVSPSAPTSGAGIATQQPLPSIPPGNIDLTAPEGTIDAGEAGIRSAGNLNLAALVVISSGNLSAGGKTTGIVSAPTISASVAAAAGAAAGAATQAAQDLSHPRTQAQEPSVIQVDVSVAAESDEEKRRRRHL